MKSQLKRLAPLCMTASLLVTASCGVMQNLQDMHDDTHTLAKNMPAMGADTSKMNQKMDGTNVAIEKTNLYIAATYQKLRQVDAVTLRDKMLSTLEHDYAVSAKISDAATYFMAMEFQLWRNELSIDTLESRVEKEGEAMAEFFRKIDNYGVHEHRIDPSSKSDDMENLDALAVTMHYLNPDAVEVGPDGRELVVDGKAQGVSLLSLIINTLKDKKRILAQPLDWQTHQIPEYQHQILNFEKDAEYMLQVRMNFLVAMTLAQISDLNAGGWKGFWTKLKDYFFQWDGKFESQNTQQLIEAKVWMDEAVRMRNTLKEIGISPQLDSHLKQIFTNMNFDGFPAVRDLKGLDLQGALVQRKAVGQLLDSMANFIDEKYGSWYEYKHHINLSAKK